MVDQTKKVTNKGLEIPEAPDVAHRLADWGFWLDLDH
jgi:hypothetical protein